MIHPWVNTALLVLLALQLLTGFMGMVSGMASMRWWLWLHGIGGYAIIALLLWKGAVILRAWMRRRRKLLARVAFGALVGSLLVILGSGVYWTFAGPYYLFGFSLLTIHVLLALAMIGLLAWHTLFMRFIFRVPASYDRRAFLRLAGISVAGLVAWRGSVFSRSALTLPGAKRRFTGSYETGSFTGGFPVVSWLLDNPSPIDSMTWQLRLEGAVEQPISLSYAQLEHLMDVERTATIDCTGGWYSTQVWRGVSLARLLEMAGVQTAAQSVTVAAVSGYKRRFSLAQANSFLLALQVGGQRLSHGHGAPVRLVALGHRGFEWIKWVQVVRVNTTSHVWQLPVPLQ